MGGVLIGVLSSVTWADTAGDYVISAIICGIAGLIGVLIYLRVAKSRDAQAQDVRESVEAAPMPKVDLHPESKPSFVRRHIVLFSVAIAAGVVGCVAYVIDSTGLLLAAAAVWVVLFVIGLWFWQREERTK